MGEAEPGAELNLAFKPLDSAVLADFAAFSCGPERYHEELVDFLLNDALEQQEMMFNRTFAFYDDDAPVGYATLVADSIERWERNQFPYPSASALLIGRLAVDIEHQGRGIGQEIMAWIRAKATSEMITGCRFIVVHVEPENEPAMRFYEKEGFIRPPLDPVGPDKLVVLLYDRAVRPEIARSAGVEAESEDQET